MERTLAALQSRAAVSAGDLNDIPAGVSLVTVTAAGVDARPRLVFSAGGPLSCDDDPGLFAPGERLEFARADPAAAAREYERLVRGGRPQVTAGALIRLARVHANEATRPLRSMHTASWRKSRDTCVEGAPASLLAGVGLASVFAETGRHEELLEEARSLARDLLAARWPLSSRSMTSTWLRPERGGRHPPMIVTR